MRGDKCLIRVWFDGNVGRREGVFSFIRETNDWIRERVAQLEYPIPALTGIISWARVPSIIEYTSQHRVPASTLYIEYPYEYRLAIGDLLSNTTSSFLMGDHLFIGDLLIGSKTDKKASVHRQTKEDMPPGINCIN